MMIRKNNLNNRRFDFNKNVITFSYAWFSDGVVNMDNLER